MAQRAELDIACRGSMTDVNDGGACRSGRDGSLHDAIDRQTEA
jgi:hypothetical protein